MTDCRQLQTRGTRQGIVNKGVFYIFGILARAVQ